MTYTYIQPPFSRRSMDREEFTKEAEAAAVFCLAEERRKKKGFLGGTEERLASFLKTNYPVYAIRWRDRCALIDGLGSIFEYVIYQDIIDTGKFLKDLEKASEEVGRLRAFLAKNDQTFRAFKGNRRMKLNGIVSNIMLLSEMTDFIRKSLPAKPTKETSVCFRIDKQTVAQIVSEFDTLVGQVEQDIEALELVEQTLQACIDKAKQMIAEDKEKELERHNQELEQMRPAVEKKIEEIRLEQDAELQSFLGSIERESSGIREEKTACEKEVKRLALVQNECLEEKKASAQRGDRVGEGFWSERAEMNKAKIAERWKTIKSCSDRLEKLQFKSDANVKRLKDKYEKQIHGVEERLQAKELARDSAATTKEIIIEELKHRYSLISTQISHLAEAKRKDLNRLIDMTAPWAPDEDSVVLVSLYLMRYESEGRTRYDVYAPVIANSYAAFRKTFGRAFLGLDSKMSRLLTPIGREFEAFFANGFLNIMGSNKRFEEAVLQAAVGTNLFESSERGRLFRAGLGALKGEGWLTEEEYQRMLHSLNLSFKVASKTEDSLADQTPE